MGYQEIKIAKGAYQLFTATFKDVGAKTYDIQQAIPYQNGVKLTASGLQMQVCTAAGAYENPLSWRADKDGWCSGPKKTNYDIGQGQAVCVFNGTGADVFLRLSGEVEFEPWSKVIPTSSYQLIGNMMPMEIDIQNFKPYIGESVVSVSGLQLQVCTAAGAYENPISWRPDKNAWCSGPKAVTLPIVPGQAVVFLNGTGSEVKIFIDKDIQ